jgi:hypothetical protein
MRGCLPVYNINAYYLLPSCLIIISEHKQVSDGIEHIQARLDFSMISSSTAQNISITSQTSTQAIGQSSS